MRLLIPLLSLVALAFAKAQYGQVYPGGYAIPYPQQYYHPGYYQKPYAGGADYERNWSLLTSLLIKTSTVTTTSTTVTTCTASVVGACSGRRRRGILIGDQESEQQQAVQIQPSAIHK